MTLDEIRRINDRRLARNGQKYYYADKVYIGNFDGSLTLYTSVPAQYNPTAGTGINISGNYPNQTISNSAPDQTVALTAGTGIGITGSYPSFTISSTVTTGILHGTATGTDTYTVTITGVTSYADGDAYLIRFTNGNTVAGPTLNINGLGAIILYRNNDGQLIGGDIWDGSEMLCIYNSTLSAFQCIGTSPNSLFAYVTNDDAVAITKGQVVYAFSGTGDRMTVKLANNTSDATSAKTVGVVLSTSIAANQKGIIIMQGLLDGLSILPTATYTDGDTLYLGSTPGSFTNIKPYAPNHLVYVAIVTTASNGSAGRMYVRVQNGYELDEIHDIDLITTPPVNNNVLTYIAGPPNLWKPRSIPTILGYTPVPSTRNLTINGTTFDLSADRTWSVGTVTSVSGTTPINSSGGTTPAISIANAVADGTTKGAATFTASDFNDNGSGVISIDYTNGQAASGSTKGFLTSADWTTFNSKLDPATAASTYVELAGDTMTGLLQFSGTTHAGIKLNNLTTAQRVALTPTSGMLVLDTDLDEFCHYNGAGWEYDLNKAVASNVTTNVVAAANITGLSFSVEANSTFLISGYYQIGCSGVGGVKFTQTGPAGSTFEFMYDGTTSTGTTNLKARSVASGTLTASPFNTVASQTGLNVRGFLRTAGTAGTLQMQFASNTNGQTSTVYAYSWVRITRIA